MAANLPRGQVLRTYNKPILIAVKIIVTAVLVAWLLTKINYGALVETLSVLDPLLLGAAVVLQVMAFMLGGLRWWVLLRHVHDHIHFRKVFPSYYLGLFFNNFLPSGVGGDVIRTIHLNLRGLRAKDLVVSALIDRTIGLMVVLLLGAGCIAFSPDVSLGDNTKLILTLFFSAMLGIVVLIAWPRFIALLENFHHRYQHTRGWGALLGMIRLCHSYRARPGLVVGALALTLLMQSTVILTYYLLGNGIGIELSLITYFGVIPIVFIAANLPVSIGGLGVRETALVALLTAANIDAQRAIALSLLYLFVLWIASVPGAGAILLPKKNLSRQVS
jgi:glycosyltransferase 2 family protein